MSEAEQPAASGLEPYPLAMILADAVHVDPATSKRTILGLFSGVSSRTQPTRIESMAVYAAVTECRGKLPLTLVLVQIGEDEEPFYLRRRGRAIRSD